MLFVRKILLTFISILKKYQFFARELVAVLVNETVHRAVGIETSIFYLTSS
jgi:hypothetical protein